MPEAATSSRGSILQALKVRGRASVDEVAKAVRVSKNAARVQLLKLESEGAVHRVVPSQHRPGRPPLIFALTPAGHARFPDDDARMLTELLAYLSERGADDLVRAFFERIWAARRADLRAQLNPDAPLRERLVALRRLLHASGFMPQIRSRTVRRRGEASERRIRVRACHCPFPGAVAATGLPCQLEREFLAEALGAPPTAVRLATLDAPGCDFDFTLPA